MKLKLFTTFWLILFTVAGWSQGQDRAIRDTGGGTPAAGEGGIYGGDGTLPEDVRASGGPNEYLISFDSVTYLQIRDYDEGIGLRIFQGTEGATKFARGITYSNGTDSLTINITDAGNVPFTIDATSELWLDSKRIVISPDSTEMDWGNATFTDSRASYGQATHGIKYAGVDLGDLVSTSLVPKAYVDQEVSGAGGVTAKYCVVGDQTETLQNVNGSSTWEIFPTATQVVNQGSVFSFSTTTDRITYTASTSGFVRIWFHFSFDTNNLADEFNVVIRKNGTESRAKSTVMANESGVNFAGSSETYISVAQNDYFEIGGYFTTNAGNMTLSELMWGVEFVGE